MCVVICLARSMPGTQLVGLGVRHGCVVLALDLVAAGASENPNNPDNWTSPLVFALSSALAACQAGRLLQDKSALTTQVRRALSFVFVPLHSSHGWPCNPACMLLVHKSLVSDQSM